MSVILETSVGSLTIDLFTDERPRCCQNFLKLCKIKYYNFSLFHSVQSNLVAQTGDPTATGKGGESIFAVLYGEQAKYFEMEVSPRIKHNKAGLVSMVNNGDGMHGSQFFITLGGELDYLDNVHTVFGEVAEGFDVMKKINEAYCDEEHRPYRDIRIYHTIILDDPYDDPPDLPIPDRSPEPTAEMLKSDRIGADEEIDDFKGKTEEEVKEMLEEKEAKANAQILEMVGDLPSADVAPDDNVLFVCKLNPVTTAEDLEMIFSRFGKITSCDVVKDHKTGESLQYAFIEFEEVKSCENAFFKMDNVLIDDRRIHVDFSQSVSKLKKGVGQFNKFDNTKSSGNSKYTLKDQSRKSHGYDLVFDNGENGDDTNPKHSKKSKKEKKKHRRSDSDSEMKHHKKKSKHKDRRRSRTRSRSPVRDQSKKKKKRNRSESQSSASSRSPSRSPVRERKGRRDRSSTPESRHNSSRNHRQHNSSASRYDRDYNKGSYSDRGRYKQDDRERRRNSRDRSYRR